jgi:hypothetical protein
MNPRQLQSNDDLFHYLVELSEQLRAGGQADLAEEVRFASDFVSGSPTEFFHEAERALRRVKAKGGSTLSEGELADATNVIQQIQIAFMKIGGA